MKRIATLMILLIALALPAAAQEYADGIYRGFYYDGGIEQIAIQFELKDGKFDSLVYRGVKYKDGDYMSEDASDAQKAILRQYRQLADYLVGKGLPFRDAYKATGEIVALCIKKGLTLETLPLEEYKKICDLFDDGVYDAINLDKCVNGRTSLGGPAPQNVLKEAKRIEKILKEQDK